MTNLFRIQIALAFSALMGGVAIIEASQRVSTNILALSTVTCGVGMFMGSVAALSRRTWGVGVVFAAAAAFAAAAFLRMGPSFFWWFALAGALPMALGAKPFARFDRGAAYLFAGTAAALGITAALVWEQLVPFLLQLQR